jgi:hypothetical protein
MRFSSLFYIASAITLVTSSVHHVHADEDSVREDRQIQTTGGTRVQFTNGGGQINIIPGNNRERFLRLKFDKLSEINSSGREVQRVEIGEDSTLQWSTASSTAVDGYNATNIKLAGLLNIEKREGGSSRESSSSSSSTSSSRTVATSAPSAPAQANFTFTVSIFQQNATVVYGNESIPVNSEQVKWTYVFV